MPLFPSSRTGKREILSIDAQSTCDRTCQFQFPSIILAAVYSHSFLVSTHEWVLTPEHRTLRVTSRTNHHRNGIDQNLRLLYSFKSLNILTIEV